MPTAGLAWPPASKSATDRLSSAEAQITTNAQALAGKAGSAALAQLSGATQTGLAAALAAGGSKVTPYAPTSTYRAGDVAVSPAGDLVRAVSDVSPASAVTQVGAATLGTNVGNIALPPGSAVGDLAALLAFSYSWNKYATGTGLTAISVPGTSSAYPSTTLLYKTLDAADIANGFLTTTAWADRTALRVFRGAGTPTLSQGLGGSNVAGNMQWAPAAQTAPVGAMALRAMSVNTSGMASGLTASDPAIQDFRASFNATFLTASYAVPFTSGTIAAGVGTVTSPAGTASSAANFLSFILPIAAGFVPAQWETLVSVSPLKTKRVAVADANYTADGTETVIAYTSLTTNRILTLPLAATFGVGRVLTLSPESVGASGFLTVNRSGSDVIQQGGSQGASMSVGGNASTSGFSVQLLATTFGWLLLRDPALDGKLSTAAGAVGLTNLADAAKPAITATPIVNLSNGGSIPAGTTQANLDTTANGTHALPSVFGTTTAYRLLLLYSAGGSTIVRNGTDTIGPSGATSLVIPAGSFTLLRSTGSSRWDIIAGAGAAQGARATLAKATASLAAGASETGVVTLGKSFRAMQVVTDRPARVRLYATAAQRAADASRAFGTAPTGNHGVLLDVLTATGALTQVLAPQVHGSNLESTPTADIPYAITNADTVTGLVIATFTYAVTEA